ncbi:thiamine pyrophosphate-dependent dehydrogenase E1 component subunit alpha [Streptomyces virginiae]|uniref:thiamine pyrophosphate-dependent dehydrogenase E1 component subunit alpha n=1 Tax=Streptomyces virginiae TaxID=1961 RepID=UPI002DDC61A3|nr:thiamine pyrophosphate-dependent dehydrogenase E1 component subunit alpha [Streptomyces virginiae]WSC80339.1 thiamine pyrophosphate-dependent dehydrogenase E1 component subunit alpha [Streptomyces virginiae]
MKTGTAVSVTGVDPEIDAGIDVDDLSSLLMIRHFEQTVLDLFARGLLNGTTHTCLGQEYVPVALGPLLDPGDFVFSNHRGHGHYLARFDDPEGLLAEMTGREGAVCSGVGGSQHIFRDTYLSTGVQGESLPVAAGTALWFRRTGRPGIAVAYIGDGTWGEGAVYEALNLAALWRLPLLVVVENNGIAQTTPTAHAMAGDIAGRAAAFGIAHVPVTGCDVAAIRARLAPVVERTRAGGGPVVVEFATHRLGPHSKGDDTRSADEVAAEREHDWHDAYRRRDPDLFAKVDDEQRKRIADAAERVLARPASVWERS